MYHSSPFNKRVFVKQLMVPLHIYLNDQELSAKAKKVFVQDVLDLFCSLFLLFRLDQT